MTMLKIEPTSANGFKIEIYKFVRRIDNTDGYVLAGVLECHSDQNRLHILRREENFKDFQIIGHFINGEANKDLGKAHSITLEV